MLKAVIPVIILLMCGSPSFGQTPRVGVSGEHLLKTAWGGSAPFNVFAPEGSTLGCHANAFAQAMYFHQLAPHGKTSYKCTNGALISEDLSDYAPKWDGFALDMDSAKKHASASQQTSRFIFYTAAIIRKDFGTNQYVDYRNDFHKKAVESHFDCTLTPYARKVESSIGDALRAEPDFHMLLRGEIDSRRPAGFYYTDRRGGGHAVVIDGYTVRDGKTYFHVNFGWFGRSDGWYLLEEDLPRNTKEIALLTIVPKKTKRANRAAL